jgi:hypothetical protein
VTRAAVQRDGSGIVTKVLYVEHDVLCGSSLCEKSHRQKKRRIIFFVVFSRRQLLALFVFKSDEIETEVLNQN